MAPTRLAQLPISAYQVSIAIDGDAIYLLAQTAVYRLTPGKPPQGFKLDLGVGPALTPSSFIFWSEGYISRVPREGGKVQRIAKLAQRPQYFVAVGETFAWIALNEDGTFSIQTLERDKPRLLVSSKQELSAVAMLHDELYFVERPKDDSWRLGVVHVSGGAPAYGKERQGRRPSMLTSSESIYYFDVDKTEIRRLMKGVEREETLLGGFACSPIHASNQIYCGSVEGLFSVSKVARQPHLLAPGRSGPITHVASNERLVVWTVDTGPDQLAVDMLAAEPADASAK